MKKNLFVLLIVFTACQKKVEKEKYNVDLSIKTNKSINSYKIDKDGNTIFLTNQVNQVGRVFKYSLENNEMDSIQSKIITIHSQECDSITDLIGDAPSYILILDNGKKKETFHGIACKNIDNLVFYISRAISKKKEKEFFESVILPTPPPPEIPETK